MLAQRKSDRLLIGKRNGSNPLHGINTLSVSLIRKTCISDHGIEVKLCERDIADINIY